MKQNTIQFHNLCLCLTCNYRTATLLVSNYATFVCYCYIVGILVSYCVRWVWGGDCSNNQCKNSFYCPMNFKYLTTCSLKRGCNKIENFFSYLELLLMYLRRPL